MTALPSRLVWAAGALLGEGPLWDVRGGALWFVDIKDGAICRYHPASDTRDRFAVGGMPSFIVPTDAEDFLIGSGNGLFRFGPAGLSDAIARVEMPADNRTNDATVDCHGRLWFGTMDDRETKPSGAVYRFDGQDIRRAGGACTITNGPAISADGRWLYHVDTLGGSIWRFDIGGDLPLTGGTLFARIAPDEGTPDGVTIDSEGCLWVAIWGGGQARRYSPDGALLATVALPCANVTKVAFGGPDLRTGFVTTARVGLAPEVLESQPLAGALFAFDAPAPGLPLPAVRLGR